MAVEPLLTRDDKKALNDVRKLCDRLRGEQPRITNQFAGSALVGVANTVQTQIKTMLRLAEPLKVTKAAKEK